MVLPVLLPILCSVAFLLGKVTYELCASSTTMFLSLLVLAARQKALPSSLAGGGELLGMHVVLMGQIRS